MYSYELFDKLSKVKFLPCELDSNKIKEYLNQLNQVSQSSQVERVLTQSQRIPTDLLCEQLRSMAQTYLANPSNPRPQYVYLPEKIGSEQYFFSQVYDLFPEISIPENIINDSSRLSHLEEMNILIVDDASFSGNNTLAKLDNLTYDNKKIKFNFIILIGYQLEPIDYLVKFQGFGASQASRMNVINIQGYIKPPTIKLNDYSLGNECEAVSTCWFDHKVANKFGSWPQIYLQGSLFDKNKSAFGNLFVGDQIPTKQPILEVFQQLNLSV